MSESDKFSELQAEYHYVRDLLDLVLKVNDSDFLYVNYCIYSDCRSAMCSRQNDYNPQYLNCKNMRDCVCGVSVCDNHNTPGYDIITDEEQKFCEDCLKINN